MLMMLKHSPKWIGVVFGLLFIVGFVNMGSILGVIISLVITLGIALGPDDTYIESDEEHGWFR